MKQKPARRPRKAAPPLSKPTLKLCPYADPKCWICQLPVGDIEVIHDLRLNKKWTFARLTTYVKDQYDLSRRKSSVETHFKRHINPIGLNPNKEQHVISKAMQKIPKTSDVATNKDMETAYRGLTGMTADFTRRVYHAFINLDIDEKRLNEELQEMSPLLALEWYSRLHKEARGQVRDIEALRSPRILISKFLDTAVSEVINQTGAVLSDLCTYIQEHAKQQVIGTPYENVIDDKTFVEVFKRVAIQYRDRMTLIRNEHMAKANSALTDLEKIR